MASICGRRVLKLFLGQHAVGDMRIGRGEAKPRHQPRSKDTREFHKELMALSRDERQLSVC